MRVYVAVFNPQGSMGGFNWYRTEKEADDFANRYRDLILGVTPLEVIDGSREEITNEIDSRLFEIEDRLGYAH